MPAVGAGPVTPQIGGDRAEVLAHGLPGLVRVVTGHRGQDAVVFRQRPFLAVLRSRQRVAGQHQGGMELPDQLGQGAVAGSVDQLLMERDVGLMKQLLSGLAGGTPCGLLYAAERLREPIGKWVLR